MSYSSFEHFLSVTDSNILALNDAKAAGRKVVGTFCIYSPIELILAADAIPVSLCGTKNESIPKAETILPRTLCPLIKSSFGLALEENCPYLAASDLVVADTTCDGKKKMFELLGTMKPVIVLQLPHIQNYDAKIYWRNQYSLLKKRLEHDFGVKIKNENIRNAMDLTKRKRRALKNILDLAQQNPAPLSGMDMLKLCFRASFMPDFEASIELLEKIYREISSVKPSGSIKPRILLTGVPTGIGSHKVVEVLEKCGAQVVLIENCSVYKPLLIDDEAEEGDLLQSLASRYLAYHCAVMSPNPNRYSVLKKLCQRFSVDAVVDLTWQGCQTYDVEAYNVKRFVQEQLKLPYLQIITDYSSSDTEQIKVRIEAFLEMLER